MVVNKDVIKTDSHMGYSNQQSKGIEQGLVTKETAQADKAIKDAPTKGDPPPTDKVS